MENFPMGVEGLKCILSCSGNVSLAFYLVLKLFFRPSLPHCSLVTKFLLEFGESLSQLGLP